MTVKALCQVKSREKRGEAGSDRERQREARAGCGMFGRRGGQERRASVLGPPLGVSLVYLCYQ